MQELLLLDTSRGLSLPVLIKSISREQHKSLLTYQEHPASQMNSVLPRKENKPIVSPVLILC